MVAYSFKKQFGPPILAGTKAQTIRAERAGRSRHARPGEMVQLYTGMRTRQCRKLGEARCLKVLPINIDIPSDVIRAGTIWNRMPCDLDAFARQDGFSDWAEMRLFWRTEHPGIDLFVGVFIRWQALASADALDIAGAA